jgi:hypothetical protein
MEKERPLMSNKVQRRNKRRKSKPEEVPTMSAADHFKAAFGWKPSQRQFHTTANRECGSCHAVKPGSEFGVPITPGRPDLNLCRECS